MDGFEDNDGCPDLDNDKDGIPDKQDKCPNEPETLNGYKDDDGCPDPGAPIVVLREDKIDIIERITFLPGQTELSPAGLSSSSWWAWSCAGTLNWRASASTCAPTE